MSGDGVFSECVWVQVREEGEREGGRESDQRARGMSHPRAHDRGRPTQIRPAQVGPTLSEVLPSLCGDLAGLYAFTRQGSLVACHAGRRFALRGFTDPESAPWPPPCARSTWEGPTVHPLDHPDPLLPLPHTPAQPWPAPHRSSFKSAPSSRPRASRSSNSSGISPLSRPLSGRSAPSGPSATRRGTRSRSSSTLGTGGR